MFRIGQDGQMVQNVSSIFFHLHKFKFLKIKDHFSNAIIIDDVNGFDNALLTPFKERLESNNISIDQINLARNLISH
jgi:hypothetical protein